MEPRELQLRGSSETRFYRRPSCSRALQNALFALLLYGGSSQLVAAQEQYQPDGSAGIVTSLQEQSPKTLPASAVKTPHTPSLERGSFFRSPNAPFLSSAAYYDPATSYLLDETDGGLVDFRRGNSDQSR